VAGFTTRPNYGGDTGHRRLAIASGARGERIEMNKIRFSRREFLQATARAAGATVAARTIFLDSEPLHASAQPIPPSDRVRFGIVGVGMEGTNLLSTAIQLPGAECAAACDLYDGRR